MAYSLMVTHYKGNLNLKWEKTNVSDFGVITYSLRAVFMVSWISTRATKQPSLFKQVAI